MSRIVQGIENSMQRIFSRNRQDDQQESDYVQIQDQQESDSVQIQDQQDSDSVQIQDQQDSDSVQIQDQQDSDSVQIQGQQELDPAQTKDEDEQDSLQSDDSLYISRVFYDFSVLQEFDQQSDSNSEQIQDQQDSDSVQIQDQQESDSVQMQDEQESAPMQIQDEQELDSVQIQDQQDSDSVQIQDQQDLDPVQIQDQQDSDSVQIHDQQDSDLALDDVMNTLSSSLDDVIMSLTSWIASVRSREPPDTDSSDSDSADQIEKPSNFCEIISNFSSQLDSLRADPGRLDPVRQSWRFKLCLHVIAYMISVYEYEIDHFNGFLKHYDELIKLGFFPSKNEDSVSMREKGKNDFLKGKAVLTEMLDLARELGLQQDVDNVTHACKLNMDMRRLVGLSDVANSGRWDQVFRYMVESVNLLDQRNRACPSWAELQEARQEIVRSHTLYGYEDDECEVEELVLLHLLSVWYNIFPPHAADVCKFVKFQSRYLDQELNHISHFIAEQPAHRYIQTVGKLMAANDMEFCKLSIDMFDEFEPDVPTHVFGLRLYSLCLSAEELDLADTAMRVRFTDNPDKQQVTELLDGLLTKLRNNLNKAADRILLNGEHDDVEGEYKLPELLPVAEELHQNTPWWVEEFRQRRQNNDQRSLEDHMTLEDHMSQQGEKSVSTTVSSDATTQEPSTSARRRFDAGMLDLPVNNILDALPANPEAAQLFNSIRDGSITFLDVPSTVENPISLQWEDYRGVQERKTNIGTGVSYHCHVLTYHPVQDEWSARSDMCKISGPLVVEKTGATCVPFTGDGGVHVVEDYFVFKIRTSSEDSLRDYMADVATQSLSLWYVDKFSKVTQDKFGYLTMLHSDCVIVYQDSRRDSILELMTREHHFPTARSVLKFDKYTNNTSHKNRKVNTDILEAFSHFTHHDSKGTLMVVDIQGWVGRDHAHNNIRYVLTDPVIHCPGEPYMFGGTNYRQEGIDKFFTDVHPTCNKICESLHLLRPEEFPERQVKSDETESVKPECSSPERVSSCPSNNPHKRSRQDLA